MFRKSKSWRTCTAKAFWPVNWNTDLWLSSTKWCRSLWSPPAILSTWYVSNWWNDHDYYANRMSDGLEMYQRSSASDGSRRTSYSGLREGRFRNTKICFQDHWSASHCRLSSGLLQPFLISEFIIINCFLSGYFDCDSHAAAFVSHCCFTWMQRRLSSQSCQVGHCGMRRWFHLVCWLVFVILS